jgi:hypothetical protein
MKLANATEANMDTALHIHFKGEKIFTLPTYL